MRITFLVDNLNVSRGGAETYLHAVLEAIMALDNEVNVLHWLGNGQSPPGVRVRRLGVLGTTRAMKILSYARQTQAILANEASDCSVSIGCGQGALVHWPHGGVHGAMRRAAGARL